MKIRSFFALAIVCATLAPADAVTFVVDDTGDVADASPGNGTCATAGAVCTVRAAIQEANALVGPDAIHFAIAGTTEIEVNEPGCGGPICANPALPTITEALTVDGTTQSGAACGDLWAGAMHTLPVHITTTHSESVFAVSAANVVIRGLWIDGIEHHTPGNEKSAVVSTGANFRLECSRIEGFEVGAQTRSGADDALIGGPDPGDGNVFLDVTNEGFLTQGAPNTLIEGNFCGVLPNGTASPALTYGCLTTRSSGTVFRRNLAAGNHTDGIVTETNPDDASVPANVTIENNRIGLALDGSPLGNRGHGIALKAGAGITISGNTISANAVHGVAVSPTGFDGATDVTLNGNQIGTTLAGAAAAGYCNFPPQVQGSYTDAGGNTLATGCTGGHGCQVADGTGAGHPGSTCIDNQFLYGFTGQTIAQLGGCAAVATNLGTTIAAEHAAMCAPTGGAFAGTCAPPGTPTETGTPPPGRTPRPNGLPEGYRLEGRPTTFEESERWRRMFATQRAERTAGTPGYFEELRRTMAATLTAVAATRAAWTPTPTPVP